MSYKNCNFKIIRERTYLRHVTISMQRGLVSQKCSPRRAYSWTYKETTAGKAMGVVTTYVFRLLELLES